MLVTMAMALLTSMRFKFIRRTMLLLGVVWLVTVAALFAFQRQLLYSPDPIAHVPPSHYEMLAGVEEILVRTADGLELTAWYAPAPRGRPTVVLFPGNSGSLRGQRYRVRHFVDAQMGVLLVAWRGYSGNPGTPSEQGLYTDATAALDWLRTGGVTGNSIVLYGVSLGSGVATRMATEQAHAAVILEAPYTSVADVAALRFPWAPVRWLLQDHFDSLERVSAMSQPLLIMHGDSDRVIPQQLGRTLYAAATVPKAGFWPSSVGHEDLFDRGGFDAAVSFIERWVKAPMRAPPAQ